MKKDGFTIPRWFVRFAEAYGFQPAALAERVLRQFVAKPRTRICVRAMRGRLGRQETRK